MTLLTRLAVFADLPPSILQRLDHATTSIERRDGDRIFRQGDAPDAVFGIAGGDGHVHIGSADRHSKHLMAMVFGAGDTFGEIAVLDGSARTAEAVVEGRVHLVRIAASAFTWALAETPQLGANLSRVLAARLRRTYALLEDASFETLEVRLARQVLYLADRHGHRTAHGTRLAGRFRQADLADLLGATPRSIITILTKWRAEGLVIYDTVRGQLTLCKEALLREMVEPKDST
jgi:CRP/FNR family transcriptional regulator, cyclic AMP receptor protein